MDLPLHYVSLEMKPPSHTQETPCQLQRLHIRKGQMEKNMENGMQSWVMCICLLDERVPRLFIMRPKPCIN